MYILATNATPAFRGKKLVIRADIILTVYEGIAPREDGTVDEVTFIFSTDHGTWEVIESAREIFDQLP